MLPTLFVSHGSPTFALAETPARQLLEDLGRELRRPKAIVVVSAHWETDTPLVNAVAMNETIHDFQGFPPQLYELRYPAPGYPELAHRITDLLRDAGMRGDIDADRGLDHGAWVPLLLMYPHAEIPVLQLSIQSHLGPAHHVHLGRALAPLRALGVLVIGSGSFTHDLASCGGAGMDAPAGAAVDAFADWFDAALQAGRNAELVTYRSQAPFAAESHPTEEHLLPLFVAMGAAGDAARARRLDVSAPFSGLRMDAYAFDAAA